MHRTGSISDVTEVQQARVHGRNKQAWDRERQQSRSTEQEDSYMETHKLKREKAHPHLGVKRARDRVKQKGRKTQENVEAFLT